jgi:hypothetical protein
MEDDASAREAAVLRAAGGAEQAPHGAASRLPLPAPPQAHLHPRRQEAQDLGVQGAHTQSAGGDETVLDGGGSTPAGAVEHQLIGYLCYLKKAYCDLSHQK